MRKVKNCLLHLLSSISEAYIGNYKGILEHISYEFSLRQKLTQVIMNDNLE